MVQGRREKLFHGCHAARIFHEHAAEYDSWFAGSPVYGIELAALQSLKNKGSGPKLEIGVGPGRFARELGIDFGIDPALAALRLAGQRGIICCQGLGEELPVQDGAVGTAYLLFTLCFGLKPQKIVQECARVLKMDGLLVIGMIPARSSWGKYLAAKKKAGHKFYEHANLYTIETVSQWLARAQMSIIEYRSTLYQSPDGVSLEELPRETLDEQAGFVVLVARRRHV